MGCVTNQCVLLPFQVLMTMRYLWVWLNHPRLKADYSFTSYSYQGPADERPREVLRSFPRPGVVAYVSLQGRHLGEERKEEDAFISDQLVLLPGREKTPEQHDYKQ